jgi:hypothetical protein
MAHEVMVLDRDRNHEVAVSYVAYLSTEAGVRRRALRRTAQLACDALNGWHRGSVTT